MAWNEIKESKQKKKTEQSARLRTTKKKGTNVHCPSHASYAHLKGARKYAA